MEKKSPIYYVNLKAHLTTGKSKKIEVVKAFKLVVKGTPDQIKKSDRVKVKFLKAYYKSPKKVLGFDLERLKIIDIEIIERLGYGATLK